MGINNIIIIGIIFLSIFSLHTVSAVPVVEWEKTFSDDEDAAAQSVQQTFDLEGSPTGYIVAGYTAELYYSDFYLVKTDSDGNELWNKTFGGPGYDMAYSVQQTFDEDGDPTGYIVAGYTEAVSSDVYLVKTDPDGNEIWNKTFGGRYYDEAQSIQQTKDGGYIVAGCTESHGEGETDVWIIKTFPDGNEDWSKTFGGPSYDTAYSIQQTFYLEGSPTGYIVAGYTKSYGEGETDVWIIKTDLNGNEDWSKTFGGADYDKTYSVQQTKDGGYIAAGYTKDEGDRDFWLVKLGEDDPEIKIEELTPGQGGIISLDNPEFNITLKNEGKVDISSYTVYWQIWEGTIGNAILLEALIKECNIPEECSIPAGESQTVTASADGIIMNGGDHYYKVMVGYDGKTTELYPPDWIEFTVCGGQCSDFDLNDDNWVDMGDLFAITKSGYWGCYPDCGEEYEDFDLNTDGAVDMGDLFRITKSCHWGKECMVLQPYTVTLTAATIKDIYPVGERVELTDPSEITGLTITGTARELHMDEQPEILLSSRANSLNLPASVYIDRKTEQTEQTFTSKTSTKTSSRSNNQKERYIIEFKEDCVIRERAKLRKAGKIPKQSLDFEVEEYRKELVTKHNEFKKKLLNLRNRKGIKKGASGAGSSDIILREYMNVFNGMALELSPSEVNEIKGWDEVKIYPDNEGKALLMDSIPLIRADEAWGIGYTGEGVSIAVIDSGIDYTHPDLGGCFGTGCKVVGGYDFYNNDDDPMDDYGHGTHCAAIAAGNGVLKGVSPDAELYAYKVFSGDGSFYESDFIAAVEKAVEEDVDIISMSGGGMGNPDDPMSQAVDNAVDDGIIVVVAAGNSGPDGDFDCRHGRDDTENSICSPGTARKAVTVGAADKNDVIAGFSSRGPTTIGALKPDVVAPGVEICAAQYGDWNDEEHCVDDEHIAISGTSMATPHVAGTAALIKQAHPTWSALEVKYALRNTAKDLNDDIIAQGHGRIDVLDAVRSSKPAVAIIDTSGRVGGESLSIKGTATAQDFIDYHLYYKPGRETSLDSLGWILIKESDQEIIGGVIGDWDISSLNDGTHTLKLVVNGQGQESVDIAYATIKNTDIIYPEDLYEIDKSDKKEIISNKRKIKIVGTSAGKGFDHYTLELWHIDSECLISCGKPVDCLRSNHDDIITLLDGNSVPVTNDVLAELDLPQLEKSGFYYLTLTTHYDARTELDDAIIYIETDLLEGWPLDIAPIGFGLKLYNQPTIADMDNDGKNDIVIGYGEMVHVLKYNGVYAKGWPQTIQIQDDCDIQKGPAVADLDNDGYNEIVAGDDCGNIHIFNHDGSYLQGWPKEISSFLDTPTIADINNDGALDIIITEWGGWLLVLNLTGEFLPGWDKSLHEFASGVGDIAVADLDNDGYNEIAVATEKNIWLFNHDGSVLNGWPKDGSFYTNTGVALADIDNDNEIEIISNSEDGLIYAWNPDGSNVSEWPVDTGFKYLYAPSVSDIDGDGNIEVMVTSEYTYCLHVYDNKGNPFQNFPICHWETDGTDSPWDEDTIMLRIHGFVTTANLDEDEELEIVTASSGRSKIEFESWLSRFHAFNHDGTIVEGLTKRMDEDPFSNVLSVGDLDNDKDNELIIYAYSPYTGSGKLYVYDLPGRIRNDNRMSWPQYQHDARHTGLLHRPESQIFELEEVALSGDLSLRVDKMEGENWITTETVVDTQIEMAPEQTAFALDEIWAENGYFSTDEEGVS